jgi:hypothetical protein
MGTATHCHVAQASRLQPDNSTEQVGIHFIIVFSHIVRDDTPNPPPWRWLDANPMLINYLPSTRMQVLLEIEQGLLAHADEAFTRPLDIDDDGQHKRNR